MRLMILPGMPCLEKSSQRAGRLIESKTDLRSTYRVRPLCVKMALICKNREKVRVRARVRVTDKIRVRVRVRNRVSVSSLYRKGLNFYI